MRWAVLVGAVLLVGFDAVRYAHGERAAATGQVCITTSIKIAQDTADLARTEGDIRAQDEEEECDLACAALERHRDVLMSEIRDYYKTLREHSCGVKENE